MELGEEKGQLRSDKMTGRITWFLLPQGPWLDSDSVLLCWSRRSDVFLWLRENGREDPHAPWPRDLFQTPRTLFFPSCACQRRGRVSRCYHDINSAFQATKGQGCGAEAYPGRRTDQSGYVNGL